MTAAAVLVSCRRRPLFLEANEGRDSLDEAPEEEVATFSMRPTKFATYVQHSPQLKLANLLQPLADDRMAEKAFVANRVWSNIASSTQTIFRASATPRAQIKVWCCVGHCRRTVVAAEGVSTGSELDA